MSAFSSDRIQLARPNARVWVMAGETIVADTRAPVCLTECGYPPRWYFPPAAVARARLVPSATRTRCPFKGEADYFNVQHGATTLVDAAWRYNTPIDSMATIARHVAFDHPQLRFHIEHY
ncbi:DUF427 domain-containing protein [Salinisphaera sp. T31B1]|uniref:DUF427 domain-containing protein n=1 Tax=Salinisphaera sp. T31B1 TaxID=727963 RepID=UPI0033427720